MAWPTMHFAVGMACGGAATGVACLLLRRGWRWLGISMTLGGLWATMPDLPRVFREDFPSLGLADSLGCKCVETTLHDWGNWFFFHKTLDAQPHEYALHGLVLMIVLYNIAILQLMFMGSRGRAIVDEPKKKPTADHADGADEGKRENANGRT